MARVSSLRLWRSQGDQSLLARYRRLDPGTSRERIGSSSSESHSRALSRRPRGTELSRHVVGSSRAVRSTFDPRSYYLINESTSRRDWCCHDCPRTAHPSYVFGRGQDHLWAANITMQHASWISRCQLRIARITQNRVTNHSRRSQELSTNRPRHSQVFQNLLQDLQDQIRYSE